MKILYIDGGGTKTATYLKDSDKGIIEEKNFPSCNINTDFENSKKTIKEILAHYNDFDKVIAGLAGASSNIINKEKIKDILKSTKKEIVVESDLQLFSMITSKKFNDENFLILNLGTGTTALHYINKNNIKTYLGWGKTIGDIGSGYDIGLNFLKYCSYCEDNKIDDQYYLNFLKDNNITSIRQYIPSISNTNNVSKISLWINSQGNDAISKFIIPRVEKVLKYIDFIKFNNLYCTGSLFLKNNEVKNLVISWYKNKKINFIEFKDCI